MHLLHRGVDSLELVWFPSKAPPYAILSHRWVEDEPTFQELMRGVGSQKAGYEKIEFCERQAVKSGLYYFWVDTVCIDKSSSAELTEALNSMYRWYRDAAKCFVYMADVVSTESDFRNSAWFTRGWTLQELLAPSTVEFYNSEEQLLGTKSTLEQQISAITGIPCGALRGEDLSQFSVAERLSWVQKRTTTREEDKAYCMLGIFDVSMAVIYGEREKAIDRLIGEIEKRSAGLHSLQTFTSIRQKIYNNTGDIMSPIDYTPPTTPPMTPPIGAPPQHDEDCNSIKHALFTAEVQNRHDQIKSFTSSKWLFKNQRFQVWEHGDDDGERFLTLRGNPGTGKSVLIKEAVKRADDGDALVLKHYFSRSQHSKPTQPKSPLEEFCTSLLYQLLDKTEPRQWSFVKKWTEILRHGSKDTPWGISQLQDAIREIITTRNTEIAKVRIFIDALDESCDDEGGIGATQPLDILSFVTNLLRAATEAKVDIRICLSRQHLPTFGELEPKTQVIIVEDHNKPALEAFVSTEMKRVEDPGLRYILYQRIIGRCTNDFLWATAVVEDVLANAKSFKPKDVLQGVNGLPRTHKEMYQRILQSERPTKQGSTIQLLQMVSGARHTMSADQFRHALAFATEMGYDSITDWENSNEGFLPGELFENYVRRESLGLVEVHDAPGEEDVIRFIHGSVDVFLCDPNSTLPDEASPWTQRSQLLLLRMCLRALDFSSLRELEPVAFVHYASQNWLYHAREAGDLLTELHEIPDFLANCSKRKTKRVIEKQIMALKESQDRATHLLEDQESLLVLLASAGCTEMLRRHLSECSACQEACAQYTESYRKALTNALIGRWSNTAMLLFEKQCDGDVGINNLFEKRTLLYRACYFEQAEVVNFLLGRGADPLIHSPWGYEYPLHAAIELGREGIMSILLQHGKVEEQYKLQRKSSKFKGCTALHMALMGGQPARVKVAILKWLLKKAPRGIGLLEMCDGQGVSVLDLARQMKDDGLPGADDLDDEIEDFYEEDQDSTLRGRDAVG